MAPILEALEAVAAEPFGSQWQHPNWRRFILTGDEKLLTGLPQSTRVAFLPERVLAALPPPTQMDEAGKRFLKASCAAGHGYVARDWICYWARIDSAEGDELRQACDLAVEIGWPRTALAEVLVSKIKRFREEGGALTPAGRVLLSLDDPQLLELVRTIGQEYRVAANLVTLFTACAPARWKNLLDRLTPPQELKKLSVCIWLVPLQARPADFLEPAAAIFNVIEDWHSRFELGQTLHQIDPERFAAEMEELCARELLAEDNPGKVNLWARARDAGFWLATNRGKTALPALERYIGAPLDSDEWHRKCQSEYKNEVLNLAAEKLGRNAVPLLEGSFATEQPEVQLQALKLWSKLKTEEDRELVATKLRQIFAGPNSSALARAVRLAGELFPESVEAELWALFSHKSRPVRDAAAGTLAKLGESRLPKAAELWTARRADSRLAAVTWLTAVGTETAAGILKARLDEEEDDDVRDAILLGLEKIQGPATAADPGELAARIKKTLGKIGGPPVPWLDPKTLPAVKLMDGSKLRPDWLLYLFHRQSRVKNMRPDIEARPLYAQIDRTTSGGLALAVLQSFFSSKADAEDRWAMAFAALLGDDRLVPVFTRQIKDWADSMRGKLAEYAVQALALLGTDAALLAVDAMTIRYRSKNRNIGKAASEAFAEAARARGLTVEELGDLVVPWFGFEPGRPRIVGTGKAQLEVHIGNDFRLIFRDLRTQKKVVKLPDSAPAELKAEFKEISAGLKEAAKSQLLRMETLMVRQFRWPAGRWQALYLQHPLLIPFAQRSIWGVYEPAGALAGSFRAIEDRSLTDARDNTFVVPSQGEIGLVHPLEMTEETRQAWLRHLADYDVAPPFPQMERPVVTAPPEQQETTFGNDVAGTELNGMTFKGRAERVGWTRGSVCDAGSINFYMKSFPAAGVDVFVETEGMFVGMDMESEVELGKIFFVKHGTVEIGSYVYDEPEDAGDSRLVPFGQVPAIAFSEAMGDLVRIAGKSEAQQAEGSDA